MKYNRQLNRALRALTIVAALAGLAGCASMQRGGAAPRTATLVFTNESIDQADVYAVVSGAQPVRIGTVFAGRTESLKVPGDLTGRGANVNVVARLLAQRNAPSTGPISINPGDRFQIRLPADQRQLVVLPGDR